VRRKGEFDQANMLVGLSFSFVSIFRPQKAARLYSVFTVSILRLYPVCTPMGTDGVQTEYKQGALGVQTVGFPSGFIEVLGQMDLDPSSVSVSIQTTCALINFGINFRVNRLI
jgi:hypothetical protein